MRANFNPLTLIGRRVEHPEYGYGVICRIRYGGIHSQVHFHNGLRIWVRTSSLQFLTADRDDRDSDPAVVRDAVQLRQMLEAFRLGIVPREDVPQFTFGRESHIERIRNALHEVERGGTSVLIEGPYGSGKTHLLEYVLHEAVARGFAVARAELDPVEVTPYKPKRVYRSLLETLIVPFPDGSVGTWIDLLYTAADRNVTLDPGHLYLSPVIRALQRERASQRTYRLLQWVGGELFSRNDLDALGMRQYPTMLDHSTAADHLGYLLTGWSTLVRAAGAKGLVILIDEAETVGHAGLRIERDRGENTLRGLVAIAQNLTSTTTCADLRWDDHQQAYVDAHGMVHSGVRPLPYAYRLPTYIGLFIAMTPEFRVRPRSWREMIPTTHRLVLWPLLEDDFRRMTRFLIMSIATTWPEISIVPEDADRIFQMLRARLWTGGDPPHPRLFLKALAELIALKRHYPHASWRQLMSDTPEPLMYRIQ